MTQLRAAIIGCGGRARGHAEGYREARPEGATVVLAAVADVARERADRFGAEHGGTVYYDAVEMLERERPDFVSIVTRPAGRADLTCLCADHGVRAILAEKPMALSLEEADRMVRRCAETGTILTVSHQMRYCREFELGKAAIDAGEIGDVYFMRTACFGNVMNQGTHVIDMARWFSGDAQVEWVMAQADDWDWPQRDPGHPAPMWTVGYLKFANDLRVTIEAGPRYAPALGTTPGWYNKRVEVHGTRGMVDCVMGNYCRVFSTTGGVGGEEVGHAGWNRATIRFIEDLARVLVDGGQHRNHAETSLHSFEIIQALALSAVRGGAVALPLPRDGSQPLGELLAAHGCPVS